MTAGFVLLILILITIGVLQDSSQNKRTYKIIMVPKTIDESNDFWTGLIAVSYTHLTLPTTPYV